MSLKAKIEAVLFVTDKPIRAQAIARIVNADVQQVRQALIELIHDYEERKGGLEIADEDGYSFQVRDEYASLMDEFLPVELSAALIRTLSAIAIKQPISQSEIIRVRGAGAYEHIKELVNRDLIAKKEEQGGRSPILSTTKKFQEYFRLSKEGKDLRTYLKKEVKKADAAAAGQLAIPSVVNHETDDQLNNRIYLETASMAEASGNEMDDATLEFSAPLGTDVPPPPVVNEIEIVAAAEIAEPVAAVETSGTATLDVSPAAAGSKASAEETPVVPAIDVAATPVAETAAAEAPVVVTPAISPAQAQPVPPVETVKTAVAETLSKLTGAAEAAHEPEPLPLPPEAHEIEPADQSDSTGTRKSTVQANTAKNKGPAMGNAKKAKQPKTPKLDKLADLLNKQKAFEKQLKLGFIADDENECPPIVGDNGTNVAPTDTSH